MILVMGGTSEANQIASALQEKNQKVLLSCATELGQQAAMTKIDNAQIKIINGKFDLKKLIDFLKSEEFSCVIDATHPFATNVTLNCRKACEETGIPYYRLERKKYEINNDIVHKVNDFEEAAKLSCILGKRVFLTIGINNIEPFVKEAKVTSKKLIVRILNQTSSINKCLSAGLKKNCIIAEDGPFSTLQNMAHFKDRQASVVVSKDSGFEGGLNQKVEACSQLNLPLVLINRPTPLKNAFYEIDKLVKQVSEN